MTASLNSGALARVSSSFISGPQGNVVALGQVSHPPRRLFGGNSRFVAKDAATK